MHEFENYDTKNYCLDGEKWLDIPRYEGIYQASNLGRIRTKEGKTTVSTRHGTRHWQPRIIRPKGKTYKTGYRVTLWKDKKCKDWLVCRLICLTFLGESELTVNHIDNNRFNNNINNLEYLTLKENIQIGFDTGAYNSIKLKCKLTDKYNNDYIFTSMSEASRFLKRSNGYISSCVKKNKLAQDKDGNYYAIEIIK